MASISPPWGRGEFLFRLFALYFLYDSLSKLVYTVPDQLTPEYFPAVHNLLPILELISIACQALMVHIQSCVVCCKLCDKLAGSGERGTNTRVYGFH